MSIDGTGRAQRGLGLIELVLAIVLIGVALGGVLLVFNTVTRGSPDSVVTLQMSVIAEEMIEEIKLKPYAAASNAVPAACARDTYNDVRDYQGYATDGRICTIDGTPIAALVGYSVRVSVTATPLAGVNEALRIDVTVTRGAATLTLTGWRTDYAS